MRDVAQMRMELQGEAKRISEKYDGAPVVVIVAGSAEADVRATVTEFANVRDGRKGRLRDQLGILHAAIQIETKRHFCPK